jgi:methylglutamate dehydrogenase subunit D
MNPTAGVHLILHANLGIARVIARRGAGAAAVVRDRVRTHLHIDLPESPRRIGNQQHSGIGLAPDTWLLTREEDRDHSLLASLRSALGSSASVCDQTDAYVVLTLTGRRLREALAKLIPIDLHPRSFQPGDAVQTLAHHVSIILWRLEDVGGQPAFELAVPGSYFRSFHESLRESGAEFGLD